MEKGERLMSVASSFICILKIIINIRFFVNSHRVGEYGENMRRKNWLRWRGGKYETENVMEKGEKLMSVAS